MYIDPFDGKFKEFPDGAKASIDHIYPQSAFNRIEGFSELPKSVQNELINHPYNLQPLPKELNSSKGAKIETGTEGWSMYVKIVRMFHLNIVNIYLKDREKWKELLMMI